MAFTHLHVHTEYSLLDGSNKIKEYVTRVKELGQTAAAITDHGVMFGCIDFYKEAVAQGIKPILGCEVYVAPGSRFERDNSPRDERYFHLVLLAENDLGYHNLMQIVSAGFTEGFYYKPRVDREVLQMYHEGIIALSACLAGEVPRHITMGDYEGAKRAALEHQAIFGEGNYFLELQDHGIPEQRHVNQMLLRMHEETGIPLVCTNDIHYTYADDVDSHDILLCIQTQKKVSDEDRMRYEGGQYYVKSEEEMRALFGFVPEALENTNRIAERCRVEIVFGERKIPAYDVPAEFAARYYRSEAEGSLSENIVAPSASDTDQAESDAGPFPGSAADSASSAADSAASAASESQTGNVFASDSSDGEAARQALSLAYLRTLCEEGMRQHYGADYRTARPELGERLDYELDTITSMGFVDYFLIVWDYINYAKAHGIIVGPGRGSAAGSIVSYALGITELDPIRYSLLFERFLNPERVSMPDIDVDFCFERRQEVIDYVVEKYGRNRVVQIVTFGTMAARGVIRDVGRALDLPYSECDRIAKMIPRELNITLEKALVMNPELKAEYDTNEQIRYLIDMSGRLEGLPRNTSMHAAGVVISKKPVAEYVPLSRASDGSITTQYTMTTLEELGLLKMDFLGLRTLTVIQDAEKLINRRPEFAEQPFDIRGIPEDDPVVMEMIGKGKCEGVFQLESAGMKSFMKELKPRTMEDIIAGIALYRPGPMDFIPRYIEGKNYPERVRYETPLMEPILRETYGCIVYQEQVMQIVRNLAGYSLGRSDLVRRAMSKKKASVMEKERRNFVYGNTEEGVPGCVSNGIPEAVASQIYDEMTDFAKYAFNKSHAAAYAVVSYQTAYLKCYYPVEFMAALLTSVIDNPGKCAEYLLHCRALGIPILPPSVQSGEGRFTAENGSIRCGMYAIKAVGRGVIDNIVAERNARGPYSSLKDLLARTYGKDLNRRAVENMIRAGALDDFGATRKQLMQIFPMVLDQVAYENKTTVTGQLSLFDFMAPEEKQEFEIQYPDVGEFPKEVFLADEKEVLGIYLSGHPLEDYGELMRGVVTAYTSDFELDEESGTCRAQNDAHVVIGGMVSQITKKYTKTNKVMAFITIEDLVGSVEVIVFPNTYEKCKLWLDEDARLFIEGRVQTEDDKAGKLIAEKVTRFEDVPRTLWIAFEDLAAWKAAAAELAELAAASEGGDDVRIFLRDTKQWKSLPLPHGFSADRETLSFFRARFGAENVTLRVRRR